MSESKKITQLPEITTAQDVDVLPIVDDSEVDVSLRTKRITKANLLKEVTGRLDTLEDNESEDDTALADHIADTNNPHEVTKAQVGLGNADNTSDADKPLSDDAVEALANKADTNHTHTASQITDFDDAVEANTEVALNTSKRHTQNTDSALDQGGANEVTATAIKSHLANTSNPHSVTKAQVGLSNVTNDAQIPLAQKASANGVASLGADGKIPTSQLPALAITDTFVCLDQAEMLALDAETGDVAIRIDQSKSYILRGSDPSVLADWQELMTPTDSVLSVNGLTGAVTLTTSNVSEGTNLYFTNARARGAISETITGISYDNSTGVFSLTAGYVIPTTTEETNWNSAYGWGNHASAGYLLSSTASSTYVPFLNAGSNVNLNDKQLLNVNALGIGTGTPRGAFDVYKMTSIVVGNPTGSSSITFNYGTGGAYASGYSFVFNVYAYKDVGATRIYSSTPLTISGTDDSSSNPFTIQFSWSLVAGADGYKIDVTADPVYGAYSDYSLTTTNTSVDIDSGYDSVSSTSYSYEGSVVVTPNSVSAGPDFYIDETTGNFINAKSYENPTFSGNAYFEEELHLLDADNVGKQAYKWVNRGNASYFPYQALELYSLSGSSGASLPIAIFGVNGEYIFSGSQAFFGFGDRASYANRGTDGGFYKNNNVINFWNNNAGQNTLSIADNGDVYVGRNGYGTFSGTGSSTSNMPAKFTVDSTATNQFRVRYNSSNYFNMAISSAGIVTLDAVGGSARFVFSDDVYITDKNLFLGSTTGSKIGATGEKIGFLGATPVARPSAYTQTYSTSTKTVTAYTTDSESSAYTGIDNLQIGSPYAQLSDLNNLRVAYENLRASYDNSLKVVNALIDDLQSLGLVA